MPVSPTELFRAALDELEEGGRALQCVNKVTLDSGPLTALNTALSNLQSLTTDLATTLKSQGDHANETDPNIIVALVSIKRGLQILNAIDPSSLSAAAQAKLASFQSTASGMNSTLATAVSR